LSRLFISHSSKNDDWAIALRDWLLRQGWHGPDDIFLDLDPERGIAAGERWAHALSEAATRCEAVLFMVSEDWLASRWCVDEYQLANRLNKKLFALLLDDIALDRLPGGLTAQWQVVRLKGEPAERFLTVHPWTQKPSPVHIAEAGLKSLKRGLEKAGIGTETFELERDQTGPFGWRAPYRGLEALEPEDAAVFFGRDADIVRGMDMLRGLAARKPPRLLVILGASGAGKSSFLRAGLWPRLKRDDGQWLALRTIRADRGGAIEGSEGLLVALEDVHRRFGLQATRANLRDRLATPASFIKLLDDLRQAAAKRALVSAPPYPLPVICLDQGEEVFAVSAKPESEKRLAPDGEELLGAAPETAKLLVPEPEELVGIAPESEKPLAPDGEELVGAAPESEKRLAPDGEELLGAAPESEKHLAPEGEELVGTAPESERRLAPEGEKFLALARAAIKDGRALLLVSIRSDNYGAMQRAKALAGIIQEPLSLGPVPSGEIGHIIREPAEILRSKVREAPLFDAVVIERLQQEIEGEEDALPLLAFVLQRLMHEHLGIPTIGPDELDRTGGVAVAIESAAEAALDDAGIRRDRTTQRDVLRRLFIPRLARINRDSKAPQRRVARQSEVPGDLAPLVHALTKRRLLVAKQGATADAATLEVAHEALLRRWPTLADLLAEDRDALLLLDGVLSAAADWDKANVDRKPDFLAHRGSRLSDAQALTSRGSDWEREIASVQDYLAACSARETAERKANETALAREARARRIRVLVQVLAAVAIVGLTYAGWSNRDVLRVRATDTFDPRSPLTPTAQRALHPMDVFRECSNCPEMLVLRAGSFLMGSASDEGGHQSNEEPKHEVLITRPFAVSKFLITFNDWEACVILGGCGGYLPVDQTWGRGLQPVINVTWDHAQAYVTWLSQRTGQPYRLLTEAEWEYAARADSNGPYFWGATVGNENADCKGCSERWGGKQAAPVGSFGANAFGLFDMLGNVFEWVQDCYHANYEMAPQDGSAWMTSCTEPRRVLRGGAWKWGPATVRSAFRFRNNSDYADFANGIRVGRALQQLPAAGCLHWVAAKDGAIPADALIGGIEPGNQQYVCRATRSQGILPGKLLSDGGCHLSEGDSEVVAKEYEVLTGQTCPTKWVKSSNGFIPSDAVQTGLDSGKAAFVCRAEYERVRGLHIGRIGSATDNKCLISYGGLGGHSYRRYEVLTIVPD
jgi:formylglycine-generating enzyme required for sulfatase activity